MTSTAFVLSVAGDVIATTSAVMSRFHGWKYSDWLLPIVTSVRFSNREEENELSASIEPPR